MFFLHHSAEQARGYCANDWGDQGAWNCIVKFFNFGLWKIDGGNIEDCFAATQNHAGAARDITVGAIGGKHIIQKRERARACERAKQYKFA